MGMNTIVKMDKSGRIRLPRSVRDELQLAAGGSLHLKSSGSRIVLSAIRGTATMRKKQGIWVFKTAEPISAAKVNRVIQAIRRERGRFGTSAGRRSRTNLK